MIQSTIKKVMNTGIDKYARIHGLPDGQIQIQIRVSEDNEPVYRICQNWKPGEQVTFNEIQDKKLDIMNLGILSAPFISSSVVGYAKKYNSTPNEISVFIFRHEGELGIAIYNGSVNVELITLNDYLEQLE